LVEQVRSPRPNHGEDLAFVSSGFGLKCVDAAGQVAQDLGGGGGLEIPRR
jgi:hypothetical protein